MKKQTIVLALFVLMCIFCMTVSSFSADVYYRGTAITVSVTVANHTQIKGGSVSVTYDTSCLEPVSGSWNLSDTTMASFVGTKGVFAFSEPKTVGGNICTLSFRVKDTAPLKTQTTVTASVKLTPANGSEKTLSVTAGQGTIQCKHSFGAWTKVDDTNHTHACSCGETQTQAHTWDSGKITKKATCQQTGERVYTCTGCGATKTETIAKTAHTYDNACDGECNVCGAKRTVSHKFSTKLLKNKKYHYYQCTVCGATKDVEAHTPGDAATEEHAQTCTVCGYVIAPALEHMHTFGDTLLYDDDGHYSACTVCGEEEDRAAHTYDDACDADCNECDYERTPPHQPADTWSMDGLSHWHECSACGAVVDKEAHTVGDALSDNGKPICTVCGGEIGETAHEHRFTEWTVIQEPTENEAGQEISTCECGETVTRDIPPKSSTSSLPVSLKTLMQILTEEEAERYASGESVSFSLVISELKNSMTAEEQKLLEAALNGADLSGYRTASCYDIVLALQIGQGEKRIIDDFEGSYEVVLTVPEAYRNTDPSVMRQYRVLHLHDGRATVLYGDFQSQTNEFRFRTDGFSTFVLLYADTPVTSGQALDFTPVYIACGALSVVFILSSVVIVIALRRKTVKR